MLPTIDSCDLATVAGGGPLSPTQVDYVLGRLGVSADQVTAMTKLQQILPPELYARGAVAADRLKLGVASLFPGL